MFLLMKVPWISSSNNILDANYSYHVEHYNFSTLFSNWKFVPFDDLLLVPSSSGNHKSDL